MSDELPVTVSTGTLLGISSSVTVQQHLPERVPESQHALMSAAMLDAKRARMKVENDRDALANRIARLQAEELRATKRIEQTVCLALHCLRLLH